jgi:hypothetical protein
MALADATSGHAHMRPPLGLEEEEKEEEEEEGKEENFLWPQ